MLNSLKLNTQEMEMTFEEFEPEFMAHFDGYVPIYIAAEDSDYIKETKEAIREKMRYYPEWNFEDKLQEIKRDLLRNGHGDKLRKTVDIEMICPLRMSDGPTRFYRTYTIPVTDEQLARLSEWASRAGDWWREHFYEQSKKLLYED